MSLPTNVLSGTAFDSQGNRVPLAVIEIEITDERGRKSTDYLPGGANLYGKVSTTADEQGDWSTPLVPNVAPATQNTRYRVTMIHPDTGAVLNPNTPLIQMPDEDTTLSQLIPPNPISTEAVTAAAISAAQALEHKQDAEAQAQSEAPFTDSQGAEFDNGAKGYAGQAGDDAADAANHAQALGPFTDKNDDPFDKGARGYAADAAQSAQDADSDADRAEAAANSITTSETPEPDRIPKPVTPTQYLNPGWLTPVASLLPAWEPTPDGYYETGEEIGSLRVVINWEPAQQFGYGEIEGGFYAPDEASAFTDTAGTTPAAPGDSVALILDRRFALNEGPEKVTNGEFTNNIEGWSEGVTASATWQDGSIEIVGDGVTGRESYQQAIELESGVPVLLRIEVTQAAGNHAHVFLSSSSTNTTFNRITVLDSKPEGSHIVLVTPTVQTHLHLAVTQGTTVRYGGVSVRELPGNHIEIANAAQRPLFGRAVLVRRNLLIRTEDITQAAWIKDGTASATDAETLLLPAASDVMRQAVPQPVGVQISYTYSARLSGSGTISLRVRDGGSTSGQAIKTITLTPEPAWHEVSVTFANTSFSEFQPAIIRRTGETATEVAVHRQQVEIGSARTNYQRVGASSLDITEAGVPDYALHRLDNADDQMSVSIPDGIDNGTVVVAGRRGIMVTEGVTIAPAGNFTLGPDRWTGNDLFALDFVGNEAGTSGAPLNMVGATVIDKALSETEKQRVINWFKARGAGPQILLPSDEPYVGKPMEGGFFAGYFSVNADGDPTHMLIVAPAAPVPQGTNYAWSSDTTTLLGIPSEIDGPGNYATLLATGDSAAADIIEANMNVAEVGGYSDWYLPASAELDILYWSFKPTTAANNTANQFANPWAIPQRGTDRTAANPPQTWLLPWRSGSTEPFAVASYWSSSESDASGARRQVFTSGFQGSFVKTNDGRVRAVRRVAL